MRHVGLIIALGVIVLASFNGGPKFFIDVGSLIIVLGITIGCLLSTGRGTVSLLKAAFGASLLKNELGVAVTTCARARVFAMAAGWIGFIMGVIIMASFVDKASKLGPGIALCLVTVFYGVVLSYVILLPIQNRLQDRLEVSEP